MTNQHRPQAHSNPMLTWKVKCQLLDASGAFHTDHVFIVQAISPSEAKAAAWKLLKQELPGDYAGWQVIMTTEIVIDKDE